MPFMLGGIAGTAAMVLFLEARRGTQDLRPPKLLREAFVALIGAMIGATFSPQLLEALPGFWPSILALLVFIGVAQVVGYAVMRRLGGYGRADALYAAMPGGLIEASILGEKAGADPKLVSVQHFIRIILVVFTVPMLFWVATGERVGSAAGVSFNVRAWGALDLIEVVLIAVVGLVIAKRVKLPASHLMGPLFLCAGLQVSGVLDLAPPPWLMHLAQFVVRVGLGAQFSGLSAGMLARGLWVGCAAVSAMLGVSFAFALALTPVVPAALPTMFLAFAPGGVTEMSLIALSLSLSPVIVAVHHLVRIICTVFITQAISGRLLTLGGSR
jgi:membrane AbrB-like protein